METNKICYPFDDDVYTGKIRKQTGVKETEEGIKKERKDLTNLPYLNSLS